MLEGTRTQLRSLLSPLQQDTHGFDSCSHLMTGLNPCNHSAGSALAVTPVNSDGVVSQRRTLHKRMCRISKWQLLLRLHRMPWMRSLRCRAPRGCSSSSNPKEQHQWPRSRSDLLVVGGAALANPVAAAATRRVDRGASSSACICNSDSLIDWRL